ncbi:MAG: hypothetical protein ACP5US_06440 [Candidatus Kryptoniota bacterium]
MKIDSVSGYSLIKDVVKPTEKRLPHQIQGDFKESPKTETVEFGLTGEEREMFASLFPDQARQINGYNSYTTKGLNVAVEPGQIINRKV